MTSEFAFRAQVILREQRELFDYWRECAQSRPIPSRFDIDPVAIPHLLPGLSLIDLRSDLDRSNTALRAPELAKFTAQRLLDARFLKLAFSIRRSIGARFIAEL